MGFNILRPNSFQLRKAILKSKFFMKLVRNLGFGRFIFRLRIFLCQINNLLGRFNQRAIEYLWVMNVLKDCRSKTLLDVGCTGSLLAHELCARGNRVFGIDINEHIMRNSREIFIKTNVLENKLPSNYFDVITVVSVIEHIGLSSYDQKIISDDADLKTMAELRRILKPNGSLILTTPYEGKGPLRIHNFGKNEICLERRYDKKRLDKLLNGFEMMKSSFFLCSLKNTIKFKEVEKTVIDSLTNKECVGSLACLILRPK